MQEVTLIFPHQLFQPHPALAPGRPVFLLEEWLYFRQYAFHKRKLWLHRASMKHYEKWLNESGYPVHYIEAAEAQSDVRKLLEYLAQKDCRAVHTTEVDDNWLHSRIKDSCHQLSMQWVQYPNPQFVTPISTGLSFFENKKSFFQTDFYIWHRKRLQLMLDKSGKPLGGKWTYDAENRQRYPAGQKPPLLPWPKHDVISREALQYVQANFGHHYGSLDENWNYPITHAQANDWLTDFLKNRLSAFGPYEDAMVAEQHSLHHSLLTPMMNIGLLQPTQIVEKTLAFASEQPVPLNSLEGFLRQVIGWREFIRIVYTAAGSRQRTTNYWNFSRKIPEAFWQGKTGIEPVDRVVEKALHTGYNHHIERLMVLGNFFLLCEFDPNEVYRWFMEMYADAYDWVMVPNVYGMTQFADGGLMTTKPYISGSNYLMKMGDWKKGSWQAIWDGLFWRFMHVHQSFFLTNPRLGMLVKTFDKMPAAKRDAHLSLAEAYLASLDEGK
jgi:deoxyribodipyrimidine photolyase-related protein